MLISNSFPALRQPVTVARVHRPMDVSYRLFQPYHAALFSGDAAPRLLPLDLLADFFARTGELDPPSSLRHDEMVAEVIAYFDTDPEDFLTTMPEHPVHAPNTVLLAFHSEDDRELSDSQRTIVSPNADAIMALLHFHQGTITLPREVMPADWIIEDALGDPDNPPARVTSKQLFIPSQYLRVALYASSTQRIEDYRNLHRATYDPDSVTSDDIAAYAAY